MMQQLSLLRERYEHDCGKLFVEYQTCVKVCTLLFSKDIIDHK